MESTKFLHFREDQPGKPHEAIKQDLMFSPSSFEDGKHQVVGNCNGFSMEERWAVETPIFAEIIASQLGSEAKHVLDFGCGVGRLAKEVLARNDKVSIFGVDSSPSMRTIAETYVDSERFHASGEFPGKVDFAYAVYVFQHIPQPAVGELIKKVAHSAGRLLVVNSVCRMAVSENGFNNDGFDVMGELAKYYRKFQHAIPAYFIVNIPLMRRMFLGHPLEGTTLHYGVLCEK